jgi:transposase-like protein
LLIEVKRRGLAIAPEVAVGDGAPGFWKASDEIYPGTRHRRCWLHRRQRAEQGYQIHATGHEGRPARDP